MTKDNEINMAALKEALSQKYTQFGAVTAFPTEHFRVLIDAAGTLYNQTLVVVPQGATSSKPEAKRVQDLKNLVDIQCSKGNYDVNEYMRGMANGLLVAMSCFDDQEPKFIEPPEPKDSDLRSSADSQGLSPLDESAKQATERFLSTKTNFTQRIDESLKAGE